MNERTYTADEVDAMIARAVIAAQPAQLVQEPLNLLEARRIADEYKKADCQVDSGNLYFALMQCLEFIEAQQVQKATVVYFMNKLKEKNT